MDLPLDVDGLIDDFAIPGGLVLLRSLSPVKNARGSFVAQPDQAIPLRPVAAHNYSGRDLLQLPESDRTGETIRVYTKVRVYSGSGGFTADKLQYRGRTWRCVQVLDYSIQGGVYVSTFVLQDVQQ